MKKAGLILLVLVVVGSWAVKDSGAGQWCFDLGNGEYAKISFAKNDPNYPFWLISGILYEPNTYFAPVDGIMVKSPDGTRRLLTLNLTFENAVLWYGYADIDARTKNGVVTFYGINDDVYDNAHSLTKVNCSSLPAP